MGEGVHKSLFCIIKTKLIPVDKVQYASAVLAVRQDEKSSMRRGHASKNRVVLCQPRVLRHRMIFLGGRFEFERRLMMTAKELRHLGKTDLLRIIREQERELEQLGLQLAQSQEKLEEKNLRMEHCGSIADAALQVSGVFQAAQEAADQYVASVKEREVVIAERTRQLEEETVRRTQALINATEERCAELEAASAAEARAYWTALEVRLEEYYESHRGLKAFLEASSIKITTPNRSKG